MRKGKRGLLPVRSASTFDCEVVSGMSTSLVGKLVCSRE